MCIFHSLENLFHVARQHIFREGGGNMFDFRKGNLWKKQHIEWVGKYFGLQKGRHGKGPTYIIKLNRALNIVFSQTWGEDSLNWGWDITHVKEIWYIIKLNRALNIVFYQTWGEDSLNWGWDITHVEEIWYIIKLNRALNIVFY